MMNVEFWIKPKTVFLAIIHLPQAKVNEFRQIFADFLMNGDGVFPLLGNVKFQNPRPKGEARPRIWVDCQLDLQSFSDVGVYVGKF